MSVAPAISLSPVIEEEEEGTSDDIPSPLLIQPPLLDTVSVSINPNKPKEVPEVQNCTLLVIVLDNVKSIPFQGEFVQMLNNRE